MTIVMTIADQLYLHSLHEHIKPMHTRFYGLETHCQRKNKQTNLSQTKGNKVEK